MTTKVENLKIAILADGTTRFVYEPEYVLPLLRAHWAEVLDEDNSIVCHRISDDDPNLSKIKWRRVENVNAERSRLRQKFLRVPRSPNPNFDTIYPGQSFVSAFNATISQGTTVDVVEPEPVVKESDLSALIDMPFVGEALAEDIWETFSVNSPEQMVRKIRASDLQRIPGIGEVKANNIYNAAVKIVYGIAEPAEGEMAGADEDHTVLDDDLPEPAEPGAAVEDDPVGDLASQE